MTTLYKKVGRRYRPVAEHEEWDSHPEGAHLIVCRPGSTMRRFGIEPDRADLLAAAEPLREQILALVVELHKMRTTAACRGRATTRAACCSSACRPTNC